MSCQQKGWPLIDHAPHLNSTKRSHVSELIPGKLFNWRVWSLEGSTFWIHWWRKVGEKSDEGFLVGASCFKRKSFDCRLLLSWKSLQRGIGQNLYRKVGSLWHVYVPAYHDIQKVLEGAIMSIIIFRSKSMAFHDVHSLLFWWPCVYRGHLVLCEGLDLS